MSIIYQDQEPQRRGGSKVPYDRWDATKHYITHLQNYFYLRFLIQKSPDRSERAQATKEVAICDRKLQFWRRHPNFNLELATQEKNKLTAQWNQT